eukprot:1159185-Pelagomonas_calceolata.AAC.27
MGLVLYAIGAHADDFKTGLMSSQCVEISQNEITQAGTLPASIKEKEAHGLKRAESLLHHREEIKGLLGIWRVAKSIRLYPLAVRSTLVFNSA